MKVRRNRVPTSGGAGRAAWAAGLNAMQIEIDKCSSTGTGTIIVGD